MKLNRIFYFCLLLTTFWSCAIQVSPSGGVKDIEPPKFISSEPANFSILFSGHDIQLNFDEFIALNDFGSQLIVSPLLKYTPEIKVRNKSLFIHILDTLIENTTYTMNFGLGITDNNEGNKLENFQFVFSTGAIIDSLDIQGLIETSYDKKTEKGVLAMAYRRNIDSLPYLEKPLYFSRTNDSGQFRINNIAPGSYKLVGLKEMDGNYLYSQGEELIGFSDSLIDARNENVNIKIFKEPSSLRFLRAYSEFPGKAVIVFNAPSDTIKWTWLTDTAKLNIHSINYSAGKDTLTIWYKNISADSLSLRFDHFLLNDSIILRLFNNTVERKGKNTTGLSIVSESSGATLQHLYLPYVLQSNHPIAFSEFDKIVVREDSLIVKPKIEFTDSLRMRCKAEYRWKSKSQYSLFIPPGTYTDIFGMTNDSILLFFTSHGDADYGSIKIIFKKTDSMSYVFQLVDEAGSFIYRQVTCNQDTIFDLPFLDPRLYRIKLIRDKNRNGKWDTGNYLNHIQPEDIEFYPEGITVRANWDVDFNMNVPFLKGSKKN